MTLYEKIIYENLDKGYQYRLAVTEFREKEYLHLRKYFLSYEGEFIPSKEGSSIECSINNTYAILDGLLEIVSNSEGLDVLLEHLSSKINDLKSRTNTDTIKS